MRTDEKETVIRIFPKTILEKETKLSDVQIPRVSSATSVLQLNCRGKR